MNKWYHVEKGVLSPLDCAELIAHAQTYPAQIATVGHGGTNAVNESIRKGTVRWLPRHDKKLIDLYHLIEAKSQASNKRHFGVTLSYFNDVQFTEYKAGEGGHYNWHQDNAWVSEFLQDRKLSVCIQLSARDAYEGGDFWANTGKEEQVKDFAEQGDLIIFPSHMWHKVTPVTAGVRYSLVTWWDGPKWT